MTVKAMINVLRYKADHIKTRIRPSFFSEVAKKLEELNESDWIPVTERLPKEQGEYLVTYHPCYWGNVDEDVIKVGFDSFRGKTCWAKTKYQKVIAWKSKPKAYEVTES